MYIGEIKKSEPRILNLEMNREKQLESNKRTK
jgi:hypothetical protein